jgi:hypothetical protein
MTKKKLWASVITVMSLVGVTITMFSIPAFAATIGEIIADPVIDTEVTISGKVTSVDGNDFVVSDGTDNITVEAGPPWYQAIELAVGDNVTITGEVDTGKDGTKLAEIEAFSITLTDDGSVITIRDGAGRPPWAGGPNASSNPGNRGDLDEDDVNDADVDEEGEDEDESTVTDQSGGRSGGATFVETPGKKGNGRK